MVTFLFNSWLRLAAGIALLAIAVIFYFLLSGSIEFLNATSLPILFSTVSWFPSEGRYGVLGLLFGSTAVVTLTILFSVPLAILSACAILLFVPQRLRRSLEFLFDIAAGIPSVVIGAFGILFLVPSVGRFFPPGHGLFSSTVVLSMVLLPSLLIQVLQILFINFQEHLLVARSLGLRDSTFFSRILWPEKKSAIFRTCGLTLGRGFGETLAILMVAGNVVQIPDGLFTPFRTINATIALEIPYAQKTHASSLYFLGLMTLLMVLFTRWPFRERLRK